MGALFSDGVILPGLVLGFAGFAVPRALARVLPEGVKPLMLNAFLSTVILLIIAAAFFLCLYIWRGVSFAQLADQGIAATVVIFGRLGVASAIIWAPIMLLSLSGLPRKWVTAVW